MSSTELKQRRHKVEDQFHMEGKGMTVDVIDLEDVLDPGGVVNDELETIEAEVVEREEESCDWCTITLSKDDTNGKISFSWRREG